MKKNIISMAAAMAVLSACGPGVPQLGKSSLDEVIGAMTLEEKAHLVDRKSTRLNSSHRL